MSIRAVPRGSSTSSPSATHWRESDQVRQHRLAEARDLRVSELVAMARTSEDGPRRQALLEEAVLVGRPLAAALARRYHRRGIEEQDLEQVAMLGLCKAVAGSSQRGG